MSDFYNFKCFVNDGCLVPVTLTKDNAVFNIPSDAEVKAALVSRDHTQLLAGPVLQDVNAAGADWANSFIVVEMSADDLAGITAKVKVDIEIQVTESGGKPVTWHYEDGLVDIGHI